MLLWRTIDPTQLDLEFLSDLKELLEADAAGWYVTCGYRSIEASNKLYAAYIAGTGPKAAPGGKSPHNFGLAVDLALDGDPEKPRLQPEWSETHPDWIRLRSKVDAHPRLHGGWWFQDSDHLERTNWKAHIKAGSP